MKVKVNHPKKVGILTKVFYTCVSNLVILAWMGLELSLDKQVIDTQTDRDTDAGNDNIQRPRVKITKNMQKLWNLNHNHRGTGKAP